ncbi:hypothetical protein M9H77_07883 [Catharanthus roseus]|uniref:Uncharacterized protein n=1 Tax=Catharanthus roseus TaxID=4058 RepID=A0ACC0BWM0_CATRO|nr:hypothetical protein M9H77_07883 [Catharanthus roseus]
MPYEGSSGGSGADFGANGQWKEHKREKLLDMQEHQGVVTRAKAKQLKSHKDQIEQKKFQGLNFDVQYFMGCVFPLFGFVLPYFGVVVVDIVGLPWVFAEGIKMKNRRERL